MASKALQDSIINVYANYQTLLLLLEGCHWNVTGVDFYQLHLLFDRLYEQTEEDVDPIAEHARYLGAKVPFSPAALQELNQLDFPDPDSDADDLVTSAIAAHETIQGLLEDAQAIAVIEDAGGTQNLLQGLMQELGSNLFLLRSIQE